MGLRERIATRHAANHWDALANEAESMAAWNRGRGLDLSAPGKSAGDHRARTYRACAAVMRLEMETGVGHCMCHLKPVSECPNKKTDPFLKEWNAQRTSP